MRNELRVMSYIKLYRPCSTQIPEDFKEQVALNKWAFEFVSRRRANRFIPAWLPLTERN